MFITSKNKYLSNDMKIFGTCSIPLNTRQVLYYNKNKQEFSLSGEHMSCFCVGISDKSTEDESDIPTKNNESVLHRWIQHSFVVVFITLYYTFNFDLMDFL